jgi:uncharacterized protein YndB with AHSA1/START domain/DNA-binding transcriptional ArsR family regulator
MPSGVVHNRQISLGGAAHERVRTRVFDGDSVEDPEEVMCRIYSGSRICARLFPVEASTVAALGEVNRLRIVELLAAAPRPVGEIATELGLRQPQVTKHLQTLERGGLVRVHALGQRRIYALRRAAFGELAEWADGLAADHTSEDALVRYERAIAEETRRLTADRAPRVVRLRRTVPALPPQVWRAWTSADLVRRWWSPQHLHVADCTVEARAGGRLVVVLEEGDGVQYRASGRFTEVHAPERLGFELSPEDARGDPLFDVTHSVRLTGDGERTVVTMRMRVSNPSADSAPAMAGLRMGWEQTLDRLVSLFA